MTDPDAGRRQYLFNERYFNRKVACLGLQPLFWLNHRGGNNVLAHKMAIPAGNIPSGPCIFL
jgi:hypothetical protein